MSRRRFSLKAKDMICERQGNVCPYCTRSLSYGRIEFDHILPLALGGADDADNLQAVHSSCHSIFKTAIDRAKIVKGTRQGGGRGSQTFRRKTREAKGLPSPWKTRPFGPSRGFDKTKRKRMNGTVETRG